MLVSAAGSVNLKEATEIMLDLGCDYAVNLDGSSACQMRVATRGYTDTGISAGKVSPGSSTSYLYGTAIIACKISLCFFRN